MANEDVKRLAGVMPRYFGIWSSTGLDVGVWDDGCIAGKVLADEYPNGKIIEMVSVDDAGEYAAAKLASVRTAINAELLETLRWYQAQMCEGFCSDMPEAGTYSPSMDNDCAGCKARAAIARAKGGAA